MRIFSLLIALCLGLSSLHAQYMAGGDISLLPDYEKAGAKYMTSSGAPITDLITHSKELGMNVMRIRLFVDPAAYDGPDKDPNACQSLEYILPLCKRIKAAGLQLMLDFHYSDTWADPAKQYTPKAWGELTDDRLYDKIYEYTLSVLNTLNENQATPDFIATGNEISFGMLWGPVGTPEKDMKKCLMGSSANWARFGKLLNRAGEACRQACPQAKIIIHTERVAAPSVLKNFYEQMDKLKVDYDIIGLSYYPYFHGDLQVLSKACNTLEASWPDKPVVLVETNYSYKWEVPGSTFNFTSVWPLSLAGQKKFLTDLMAEMNSHKNVAGLVWWWMEYNAYGTSLSGWYNAPLFDSQTGRATPAYELLPDYLTMNSIDRLPAVEGEEVDWYDLQGRKISYPTAPGIYVTHGKKVIVK